MSAKQMTKRLNLRIDAKLMKLLRDEAKRKRQSLADVTRSALADHLMAEAMQPTQEPAK